MGKGIQIPGWELKFIECCYVSDEEAEAQISNCPWLNTRQERE